MWCFTLISLSDIGQGMSELTVVVEGKYNNIVSAGSLPATKLIKKRLLKFHTPQVVIYFIKTILIVLFQIVLILFFLNLVSFMYNC